MTKRAAFSMALMLASALPAYAQTQGPPLRSEDPRPMPVLDPIEGPVQPAGRRVVAAYGACVADRSPQKALALLLTDFRTREYRNGLRLLSDNNRDCFGRRGKMRSDPLLFAGAIAERLLESGDGAIKGRLARAAAASPALAFSPSDELAQCIVRAMPDDVSALFATDVGTDAETAAVRALDIATARCGKGQQVDISAGGLRSILATAALRSVEAVK